MSLLTGKCKKAFGQYIKDQMYYIGTERLGMLFITSLYIEFFDSVQIYIQHWGFIDYVDEVKPGFDASVVYQSNNHSISDKFYNTRQLAINDAILKANELFNQHN